MRLGNFHRQVRDRVNLASSFLARDDDIQPAVVILERDSITIQQIPGFMLAGEREKEALAKAFPQTLATIKSPCGAMILPSWRSNIPLDAKEKGLDPFEDFPRPSEATNREDTVVIASFNSKKTIVQMGAVVRKEGKVTIVWDPPVEDAEGRFAEMHTTLANYEKEVI